MGQNSMNGLVEFHVFGGKKGESIVVGLPGDRWGVVDNYTANLAEPRSNPTVRFLESRKVNRLTFLCLTHPHEDHYRGMSYLLERFDPERVWLFGAMTHRDLYSQVADVLRAKAEATDWVGEAVENTDELVSILDSIRDKYADKSRIPQLEVRRLQLQMPLLEVDANPPLRITAIGASGGRAMVYERTLQACFDAGGNFLPDRIPSVNHNMISGGLLIEYGLSRVVLGGDIDREGWSETIRWLSPSGRLGSQLVKVSHHGSANGYCDGLWAQMSPGRTAIAVITPFLSQGLPSPEGLSHISEHARLTLTASMRAVALAANWEAQSAETSFSGLSADTLLTLRAIFPRSIRPSDRLEGVCSLYVNSDGAVTHEEAGDAGVLGGG